MRLTTLSTGPPPWYERSYTPGNSCRYRLTLVHVSECRPIFGANPLRHGHLHHQSRGSYLRTNPTLAAMATTIAAWRLAGWSIRSIAAQMGASRSGVHGILVRIGLAGYWSPGNHEAGRLSRRAAEAVSLLAHRHARRLTWRQRVVLQGLVGGLTTNAIAAELGIQPASVASLMVTARRRLSVPWRRRSRARRSPPADPATLLAALGHDHLGKR